MIIWEEKECRICKGELERVLDLGNIYPSSFIREGEDLSQYTKAPLILDRCKDCGLVQLEHTVDLDSMYKKQYWYASSLNKSMVSSLKDIVEYVEKTVNLKYGDAVLDIGCNDGTLLNLYSKDTIKIGFDPAPNLYKNINIHHFVNDYFSVEMYHALVKPKVITAIAMFYDLPDPNKFVEDVKTILHEKGIFVIQFTDLLSMFKACAFDNICHEHLEYYTLKDVTNLLKRHGLEAIDVSYNDVNGGSIRITACHSGAYLPSYSVTSYLEKENNFFKENTFKTFNERIESTKQAIKEFLFFLDGKCFLLGASTKGNTLLQVCGITNKDIPYAAEVNKDKLGLRTLGSNIKIISEDDAFKLDIDYLLVLPWHFKSSLLEKDTIKRYIHSGGHLVFPLPKFEIIGKENLKDD